MNQHVLLYPPLDNWKTQQRMDLKRPQDTTGHNHCMSRLQ